MDSPSRKLVRQIFEVAEKQEKEKLVLRLRAARERVRKETGRCEGSKAFGTFPEQQPVIDRIVELRHSRMAVDTIADTLNREGLKSKTGGKWYGSSVRNVLIRSADIHYVPEYAKGNRTRMP